MRFQTSGQYLAGAADVDPEAVPGTILGSHVFPLAEHPNPARLGLLLLGVALETLTLDLYFLVDETDPVQGPARFVLASNIWVPFATGVVLVANTPEFVGTDLPAGGVIYGRRTADAIAPANTRKVLGAWL